MLKVIDLDAQGKDSDGYVFTLTIGAEKVGITDLELTDLIKARYAGGRSGAKRQALKRSNASDTLANDSASTGLDGEGGACEAGDPGGH